MSRRTNTLVLAGVAAFATLSLAACGGSLDGSAHAVASAGSTASTTVTASATPSATPAPVVAAAPAAGAGTGRGAGTGGGAAPAPAPAGGSTNGGGGGSNNGGGGAPAASGPKILKFTVSKPSCSVNSAPGGFTSDGSVTLSWRVSGADGAAIAVDNPDTYGAYGSDYPASGSLELPFGCGSGTTTHTYTVWPAGAKNVSKSISVSAHSDN